MTQKKIIVVVRQAGSAAGIIPAVEKYKELSVIVIAFPLAAQAFREVAGDVRNFTLCEVNTEAEAHVVFNTHLPHAGCILTGTSSEAQADAHYWRAARAQGLKPVAYLDQWSNIEKRFPGPTGNDWPDRLIVIDAHDKQLAQAIAPRNVRIHVIASPALKRIRQEVAKLRAGGIKTEPGRFVFATEPVADPAAYRAENGFCDEDSFKLAVALICKYHPGITLVMRLHPRDSRARWLPLLPPDIAVEWDGESRAACLARAGKVYGMRSFFLLEALAAGVPVVSLQPCRKTACPLTDGRMPVLTALGNSNYD